jgi:hypothetical protein
MPLEGFQTVTAQRMRSASCLHEIDEKSAVQRHYYPVFMSHILIVQSRDAETTLSLFGSGMKATDDTLCS